MIDRLEQAIVNYPPGQRRRLAIHVLLWSVVAMLTNDALYGAGIITNGTNIVITMNLSWLALTITAADLVSTTDVRTEVEDT